MDRRVFAEGYTASQQMMGSRCNLHFGIPQKFDTYTLTPFYHDSCLLRACVCVSPLILSYFSIRPYLRTLSLYIYFFLYFNFMSSWMLSSIFLSFFISLFLVPFLHIFFLLCTVRKVDCWIIDPWNLLFFMLTFERIEFFSFTLFFPFHLAMRI
jgi:hypothetical protein